MRLPDVTLVAVDCVAHLLTRRALEDSLRQIEPASTVVWSDHPDAAPNGAMWVQCEALRSLDSVADVLWRQLPKLVKTSHYLLVQWDGWVLDCREWSAEFLEYDYIGAPWWFRDGLNVGNGGFSLRSTRLSDYLATHVSEFPIRNPEDYVLCRSYRNELEAKGFRWAPDRLAWRFSFERTRLYSRTFGFHGHFNWPYVLPIEALQERIVLASGYARTKFLG